jgi:poly-gamma-glutamate synthesis protein (capsule biosynthesis protein)
VKALPRWVLPAVLTAAIALALGGAAIAASPLTSRLALQPSQSAVPAGARGLGMGVPTPAVSAAVTTQSAEITPSTVQTITIVAVGDMLMDSRPRRLIDAKGVAIPLASVASRLRSADLTIANLESTLSNRGAPVKGKPANLIFNGNPKGIGVLSNAGIDVVSTANNHAMDHGQIALADTISALDKAGIKHAGSGLDIARAWTPAYLEIKGRRIAYIAATQILPAYFLAGTNRAGVANGHDLKRLAATIKAARKKADIVIVSMHWGVETIYKANAGQQHDARALIDAGADMILAHHPHVLQGIDTYKGKLIAYSLGNFFFPYKGAAGRESFILRFEYGPKGATNVTAIPIYLGAMGEPIVQTGARARTILGKLAAASKSMGTKVTISNGIGYVKP